jgi:hypothetical protein
MEKSIPSMGDILNALSDDKALDIFKIIALSNCDNNILITKTKLTFKQYYSKMDRLIKAGLVRKKTEIMVPRRLVKFSTTIYK